MDLKAVHFPRDLDLARKAGIRLLVKAAIDHVRLHVGGRREAVIPSIGDVDVARSAHHGSAAFRDNAVNLVRPGIDHQAFTDLRVDLLPAAIRLREAYPHHNLSR